jgi:hypothetical protein
MLQDIDERGWGESDREKFNANLKASSNENVTARIMLLCPIEEKEENS